MLYDTGFYILDELLCHMEFRRLFAVLTVIKFFTIDSVWCAWGNMINNASFLDEALNKIYHILAHKVHWYHYGELTKLGNPRHPLYVKSGSGLKTFDIDAYMILRKMLVS